MASKECAKCAELEARLEERQAMIDRLIAALGTRSVVPVIPIVSVSPPPMYVSPTCNPPYYSGSHTHSIGSHSHGVMGGST